MHARLALISVIAITLLSTGALADCLAPHNLCDTGYANRAVQESGLLQSYYENNQALYEGTDPDALRYPAALFFLSIGRPDDANTILGTAFAADPTLTQDEAVYLAWAEAAYGDDLNTTIQPEAARRLTAFSGTGTTPEDALLNLTAHYLHAKASDPSTTTGVSALTALLRERGDRGWPSEADPANLARVVAALAALYSQAADVTLQRLAEMNLDILTARFAALDAGGAIAGIRAGDTLGSGAYDPESAPWNGWAFLLFGPHTSRATEPSILVSGYCASAAALGVNEARALPNLAPEAKENFSERQAFSYTEYRDGYLLSGTRDVDGHVFNPVEGFATRATVRFTDDADSFMLLTTQTSDNATGDPGQQTDGGNVYATKDLIIGTLGGSTCQEPHLLLSRGFEYADGYVDGIVKPVSDLILIHHVASDTYWAFRFLGGQHLLPVAERYAPLANALPVYDRSADEGYERGATIIPDAGDEFVLQRIPPSFIKDLLQNGASIEDIADAVAANTSFSKTVMNALQYTTRYTAPPITYSYTPGVAFQKNSVLEGQADFSLRSIAAANYPYLSRKSDGVWRIQGLRNEGNTPYYLELDFADATKNATEGTYGCEGTVEAPAETSVQPTTPSTQLAFLAASLLQDVSGDYVMDCGTPNEVLPNPQSIGSLAIYACVLERGNDRIVGFVYDPSQPDVLLNILQDLKVYYPFTTGATAPPPTACNNIADTAQPGDLTFHRCGAYSGLAVYLSPNANALVLSKGDANPFTSGLLDSVVDFFSGLFGTPSGQGADPSTSGSFVKAYFSKRGDKRVDARVTADEARVRFENLTASVETLKNVFGANAHYLAGGHVQELITSSGDLASWKAVTAALRLQDGGTPADFTQECGNNVVEYGEECDPAADANGVVRACDALSSRNITCVPAGQPNQCTLNTSQCAPTCQDLDQDGYNVSVAGAACGPADCDDQNRSTARVFDADGNRIDCAGSGDCSSAPYSACPQCVHPDQTEVCGDNIDTNCNGLSDLKEACPLPPTGGGSGDTITCAQDGACSYVCDVTVAPPACTPCLTDWTDVETQGNYTFATRINDQGKPELRITGDGTYIKGKMYCKLCDGPACSTGTAVTNNNLFSLSFTAPNPASAYRIFHDGGATNGDVSLMFVSDRWTISGKLDDAVEGTPCWDVPARTPFSFDIAAPTASACDPGCNIVTSGCASNADCTDSSKPVCVVTGTTGTCVAALPGLCNPACSLSEACKDHECWEFNTQ